ncbi:MAG: DUF1573 domain-containing protein [Mangrovibacterium sp.]|nr:DUF1573 domain-containing protein [Mangrovibacterium sp.]
MRYFVFVFFLLNACILSCPLDAQIRRGSILFEEKVHDFGEIMEKDGKVSHTFIFKNTGGGPVVIEKIRSGCSCISAGYSDEPVLPGQKGQITITYNPRYRPGFFSKEITVYTGPPHQVNRIWVKGTVTPYAHPVEEDYPYDFGHGLHLNLKVLAFGKASPGERKEIRLRYANDADQPMILDFMIGGNGKDIGFTAPGELSPKERGEMIVSYTCPNNVKGEVLIMIYPVVNGKKLLQPLHAKVTGAD